MTLCWTTEDGRRVPLTALRDQHLYNIMRMLRRYAAKRISDIQHFYLCGPMPQGECAQDAYWDEWDYWCDDGQMANEIQAGRVNQVIEEKIGKELWEGLQEQARHRQLTIAGKVGSIWAHVFGEGDPDRVVDEEVTARTLLRLDGWLRANGGGQ